MCFYYFFYLFNYYFSFFGGFVLFVSGGGFVSLVAVVSFQWFRFACSGGFVSVVSFRL